MTATRAEQMREAYVSGDTLAEVGREWLVSNERVRQIINPLLTPSDRAAHKTNRAARKAEQKTAEHQPIVDHLNEHPHESFSDVAAKFGVDRRIVSSLWHGPERPQKARFRPLTWTDEDIKEALARILDGLSPTVKNYTDVNTTGPSAILIIRRFGTWQEAIAAAGLNPNPAPRLEYASATDDYDSAFVEAVAEFLNVELDGGHTWRQFVQWANGRKPSPHTMRAMASITYGEALRLALDTD